MITEFFRLDTSQAEAAAERFASKASGMGASLEEIARGAELVALAEVKQARATRLAEEAIRKKAEASELAAQADRSLARGDVAKANGLRARSEKTLRQSVELTKKAELEATRAERSRVQAQKLLENSSRKVLSVQERLNRAFGRAVSLVQRQIATGAVLATTLLSVAGAARGVGDSIETFAGFEHRLAGVSAVTQAVGVDFGALRQRAEEMGETTLLSATQAASGMEFLGRSGFAVHEILDAIPAVLDLAVAGTLDLGSAANLVSNLIRAFQLEADQAVNVVDVLAATAASSNTDLTMLGESFKFVAPLASGLGVALPSVSAALGVLANVGLKAELGGTGLRMAMLALANASPKTQKILEQFGVSLEEVDFMGESLEEVLLRLQEAGLGVNEAFAIAGARGGNALNVLISQAGNVDTFAEKLRHVEGTGKAMAATMADTVRGALTLLGSRFEALQLQFGSALEPRLRATIDTLAELAERSEGVAEAAGSLVGRGMSAFVAVLDAASTHGDILLGILAALAAGLLTLPLAHTIASFWGLVRASTALGVAQNTLLLATVRLKLAWTAMTGAMARNPAGLVAIGVAALAGGLTVAALRSAEAREEAERYYAALEAGHASAEQAAASQDNVLARLEEERDRRRELTEQLDEQRERLDQLGPLAASMAEVLDVGDADSFRELVGEARELGVALDQVGRQTAFEQLGKEIELVEARIARLGHESDVAARSIGSLESSFGENAVDILDSLIDRRRDVSSVFFEAREEAAELGKSIESLPFDETRPEEYARALNRLNRSLSEARATAAAAEAGLAAIDRQLTTTSAKIEKAGGTLEIFSRNRLLDAARASIDQLFQTGQLEKAEQILRRLPKDVLSDVFPGETIDEILAWQRQLQSAFEAVTEEAERSQKEQAKASEDLQRSLERLGEATREQQALRLARDLDAAFGEVSDRIEGAVSNEGLLTTALQAGLEPLRFVTGEYSERVKLAVRQLALETAINQKTAELAQKKAELVEREREIARAQNEAERDLIDQGQQIGERRRLDSVPDPDPDPEAFLPSPEEMRRLGEGLVEDLREEWSDGIDALQGLWRAALDSILEEGTLSFESLGSVISDIFDDVFARFVDQAIESLFIVRQQGEGLPGLLGGGGGSGGPLSSFFGDGASNAASILTVAAIAKTAFDIAERLIEGRRGKTFSLPITVQFSKDNGFSGQALGGNIAEETGLDFVQISQQIRSQIQDLRLAIGGSLEFLPELAIQVRRDGEEFKLSIAGVVVGTFGSLGEAIEAGLELALRDADFSGLGRNMQALLDRLGSIGLENADPFFELARALDSIGVNEVTLAFRDLNTLFSVQADRVREMGGSEADLLRLRNEAIRELGERVRATLGQFVEGFDALQRVQNLLKALADAEAFNAGLANESAFRDSFVDRFGTSDPGRVGGGGPGGSGGFGGDGFRPGGPSLEGGVLASAATLETAAHTASQALGQTVTAMGLLQDGVSSFPAAAELAYRGLADISELSGRSLDQLATDLEHLRSPASAAGKSLIDLGTAAGDIAPPLTRLPDELREAAADIPPAIESAFAQIAVENEAARLQASLSSGLADFLGSEEERREAERLTHQLKLAQMRLELEALRILAQETGLISQDVIDRYDRLLNEAERRFESGQGPRRRGGGGRRAEREAQDRRRDELQGMIDDLRSGLTGAAADIARTREETEQLAEEMRELGLAESDVADFVNRRAEADAARARESQLSAMSELARLAGDQEQIALLEREAALARIDTIEREMESLHALGLISDEALASAQAAAAAARQGVNDAFEAEHGLQVRRRAFLDELGRLVPEIADFRAYQELRTFLEELPQRAEELGLATERLRNQVTRGLELNFFDSLSRFSGFDNEDARQREKELRDRQALANLRLQLALLEQFGALSEAQLEQYRGWVAEVEEGLLAGTTLIDQDQIRQDLSSFIPSLATVLEVEQTIAFFADLDERLRSIGATEEEIQAARQEASEALYVSELERLARATGNEEALRIAADLRHQMEVANYRLRLQLLEQEGILTAAEAAVIRGLIDEFEAMDPGSGGGGIGGGGDGPIRFGNDDAGRRPPPSRENRQQRIGDLDELRTEIEGMLHAWREVSLDDVTRQARDLIAQRAELEDMIRRLQEGRRELFLDDVEFPELEEAFTAARRGFLDSVLGEDDSLDPLAEELQNIFTHFDRVRSALEELGGSAADFGRVAETEARRLADFEGKLFSPVDTELEAVRGLSRSDTENRRALAEDFRGAIERFRSGDLSAAADAVELSQALRSQVDQLRVPGERRALLAFLESQLAGIREAGIPTEVDVQERLADFSGRQLETQERIASLLEEQNTLLVRRDRSTSPGLPTGSPLLLPFGTPTGPTRLKVRPAPVELSLGKLEKRLDKVSTDLAGISRQLDKLNPVLATLQKGNQQRQQVLGELRKSKGVST